MSVDSLTLKELITMLEKEENPFEYIVWNNSLNQLKKIYELLETDNTTIQQPKVRQEIEQGLIKSFKYLDEYRDNNCRVILSPDHPYNFNIMWQIRNNERTEWRHWFPGLLQFNGCPGAFPAVTLGEPRWWSIHT